MTRTAMDTGDTGPEGVREPRAGAGQCGSCHRGGGHRGSRRDFVVQGALALAAIAGTRLPLSAAGATVRLVNGTVGRDSGVTYPIPAEDGVTVDRRNQVILVRWEDHLYAFGLSCPHQRTALRWDADDARFQCPKHHSRYAPDGRYLEGRATRSMDRFGVRLDGDQVVVDTGRLYHEDEDPAEWRAAVVPLAIDEQPEGGDHEL